MSDIVIRQPKYRNVATGDVVSTWDDVVTLRLANPTSADYQYWQDVYEAQVVTPVDEI